VLAPCHTDQSHPGVIDPDTARVLFKFKDVSSVAKEHRIPWRHSQITTRAQDIRDLVDCIYSSPWKKVLSTDQSYIAVGHSFGGATVIHTLFNDARCSRILALDSWGEILDFQSVTPQQIKSIKSKFAIILSSDLWNWENNLKSLRRYIKVLGDNCIALQAYGTRHHNYNDIRFWTRIAHYLKLIGPADPEAIYRAILECFLILTDPKHPSRSPRNINLIEKNNALLLPGHWRCPENKSKPCPKYYGQPQEPWFSALKPGAYSKLASSTYSSETKKVK